MKAPVSLFLKLFRESFLFAIEALRVNKLRTTLSLLGITIGIFAIILVFTVTDALEKNVRDSVASLGDNVVYIQRFPWMTNDDALWEKYMARPVANYNELRLLKENCES